MNLFQWACIVFGILLITTVGVFAVASFEKPIAFDEVSHEDFYVITYSNAHLAVTQKILQKRFNIEQSLPHYQYVVYASREDLDFLILVEISNL